MIFYVARYFVKIFTLYFQNGAQITGETKYDNNVNLVLRIDKVVNIFCTREPENGVHTK